MHTTPRKAQGREGCQGLELLKPGRDYDADANTSESEDDSEEEEGEEGEVLNTQTYYKGERATKEGREEWMKVILETSSLTEGAPRLTALLKALS